MGWEGQDELVPRQVPKGGRGGGRARGLWSVLGDSEVKADGHREAPVLRREHDSVWVRAEPLRQAVHVFSKGEANSASKGPGVWLERLHEDHGHPRQALRAHCAAHAQARRRQVRQRLDGGIVRLREAHGLEEKQAGKEGVLRRARGLLDVKLQVALRLRRQQRAAVAAGRQQLLLLRVLAQEVCVCYRRQQQVRCDPGHGFLHRESSVQSGRLGPHALEAAPQGDACARQLKHDHLHVLQHHRLHAAVVYEPVGKLLRTGRRHSNPDLQGREVGGDSHGCRRARLAVGRPKDDLDPLIEERALLVHGLTEVQHGLHAPQDGVTEVHVGFLREGLIEERAGPREAFGLARPLHLALRLVRGALGAHPVPCLSPPWRWSCWLGGRVRTL
mmetsp:Transcript_23726/g.64545  ORF Transcript_23726/g.64545 Transcript_23726/m.64545 type:complete len:388 (+) Transcript_23726:3-1166(+)